MQGIAIGYTRVSTGAQASSGLGIAAQEKAIRRFCAYKDLELVYIYEDPGESGGLMLQKRPSGQALWKRLQESEADPWSIHLVASKLDRLWRNVPYMHVELAELKSLCVNVHTVNNGRAILSGGEDVDAESQALSDLFTQFIATIDELERIRARERTAEALAEKRARGEHVGTVPFGSELRGGDGQLYDLEPELATLGMLWHFREHRNYTQVETARELNKRNRRPKRSKKWTKSTVFKQLHRMKNDPELREKARLAFARFLEKQARRLGV